MRPGVPPSACTWNPYIPFLRPAAGWTLLRESWASPRRRTVRDFSPPNDTAAVVDAAPRGGHDWRRGQTTWRKRRASTEGRQLSPFRYTGAGGARTADSGTSIP